MLMHTGFAQVDELWLRRRSTRDPRWSKLLIGQISFQLKRIPEKCHQWICSISHLDSHNLMPGMTIEIAADEIKISGQP